MRLASVSVLLGLAFAAAPAFGQAEQDPAAGAAAAGEAAADLEILRAFAAARLGNEPLRRLLPPVENAHRQLSERDRLDTAELRQYLALLQAERRQAVGGQRSGTSAEERYRQAAARQEQRREELLEQLTASLLRQLGALLTPEQLAALGAAGEDLHRRAREQQLLGMIHGSGPRAAAGLENSMNRLRDLPPAQWDLLRGRMLEGNVGAMARLLPPIPGARTLVVATAPAQQGARVTPPTGRGDPPAVRQTTVQRTTVNVTGRGPAGPSVVLGPVDPNDPVVRATIEQLLGFGERLRSLSAQEYEARMAQLGAEYAARAAALVSASDTARARGDAPADEALRRFVRRCLLSPRAPALIRERLGAR